MTRRCRLRYDVSVVHRKERSKERDGTAKQNGEDSCFGRIRVSGIKERRDETAEGRRLE